MKKLKKLNNILGFKFFRLKGSSMEPLYKDGDIVFVRVNNKFYKKDDVVLFFDNIITHKLLIKRINTISEDKVYVLGDNSKDSLDSRKLGWIDMSNIIGKVVWSL